MVRLPPVGSTGAFVSKLGVGGDLAWTRSFGGPAVPSVLDVAADAAGNVYVSGSFPATVDFRHDNDVSFDVGNGGPIVLLQIDAAGLVWSCADPSAGAFDVVRGDLTTLATSGLTASTAPASPTTTRPRRSRWPTPRRAMRTGTSCARPEAATDREEP